MSYQPKPNEISVKSVKTGQTEKGSDYVNVSLTNEEFSKLVSIADGAATDRGIKLSLFIREAKTKNGRAFTAGTLYVDGIKEPRQDGGGGGNSFRSGGGAKPAASGRFVRKAATAETTAAASSVLNRSVVRD